MSAVSDSASTTPATVPQSPVSQKRTHKEEPVTASGRAKQQKQDILQIEARHVGRAMDAFLTPGAMFNHGMDSMASMADTHSPDDDSTPEQIRYFKIYKHLCSKIPHFEARIVDVDARNFHEHEKMFKAGLSAARSDDIASLKGVIIDWLSAPPYSAATSTYPLARNSKNTRGFNNPVIGELLCPTDLDWSDSTIQQGLRDGTIDIQPSQWPNFVYEDGVPPADGEDMWVGFLRHQLLVKTIKHIYTSPSSVDGADGSRATRSSKAALAGMTGITVGAIADAVVKLQHSLSSNSTFQKNCKTTHNESFYYSLLEILEAKESREQVQELLRWYDRCIRTHCPSPGLAQGTATATHSLYTTIPLSRQLFPGQEGTTEPAPNSALARMRAQLGIGCGAGGGTTATN